MPATHDDVEALASAIGWRLVALGREGMASGVDEKFEIDASTKDVQVSGKRVRPDCC